MTTTNPTGRSVPRVRSALFVPAHRADFLAMADRRGSDALILDLEDGVPKDQQDAAREQLGSWLLARGALPRPIVIVRIHPAQSPRLEADLAAVVGRSVFAVALPKVSCADQVTMLSEQLAWHEGRCGLPLGSTKIWPLLENATAVLAAGEIARSTPRVAFLGGATAAGGDLAGDLGLHVTEAGLESLFLRSQVLLEARAAGVPNPLTGLVTALDDDEAVEGFASRSRQLGYEGMMVIHPRHVPVVNRVFTPTQEEVLAAQATLAALGSDAAGGARRVGGQMVDTAMGRMARRVVAGSDRAEGAGDHTGISPER